MLRLTTFIGLVCCSNPLPVSTDPAPRVLVLPYDAFGPQAMSVELIGFAWPQWEGGGSFEPGDRFDVRVVVHRDGERGLAAASHPTVPGFWDRRYVSRSDALAFIDRNVAELVEAGGFDALAAELRQTRAAIVEALPPSA
ncbi:MAG: hypothetical protein AMXMBFR64_26930 [Myxococcales bacterium]